MARELTKADQALIRALKAFIDEGLLDIEQIYPLVGFEEILSAVFGHCDFGEDRLRQKVLELAAAGLERIYKEDPDSVCINVGFESLINYLSTETIAKIIHLTMINMGLIDSEDDESKPDLEPKREVDMPELTPPPVIDSEAALARPEPEPEPNPDLDAH